MTSDKKIPQVALVGRPNVGKSSLFNRLLGERKAIVRDESGITRDFQKARLSWDGLHLEILDTAGFEIQSPDDLQRKIQTVSKNTLKEADLILFVLDVSTGPLPLDREWIHFVRKLNRPCLYLINKVDQKKKEKACESFYELGLEDWIPISAEFNQGLDELKKQSLKILRSLGYQNQNFDNEKEDHQLFRISLIGRPNVGKSTLLNRLTGQDRSITHNIAGTTRDPVEARVKLNKEEVLIIDTAGLKRRGNIDKRVDEISTSKTILSIRKTHLCLFLVDGIEGVTAQDAHVIGAALKKDRAVLILINKWDEASKKWDKDEFENELHRQFNFIRDVPVLYISALTGQNVQKIEKEIFFLRQKFEKKIATSALNQAFEEIVQGHPLPTYRGKAIKIYYMTQVKTRPPTFVFFTNEPKGVHFSYKRYIINQLKEKFDLKGCPLKLIFKKR